MKYQEKEVLCILKLYYPSLSIDSSANNSNDRVDTKVGEPGLEHQKARLVQKIRLTKVDSEDAFISEELESIERHSQVDLDDSESRLSQEDRERQGLPMDN